MLWWSILKNWGVGWPRENYNRNLCNISFRPMATRSGQYKKFPQPGETILHHRVLPRSNNPMRMRSGSSKCPRCKSGRGQHSLHLDMFSVTPSREANSSPNYSGSWDSHTTNSCSRLGGMGFWVVGFINKFRSVKYDSSEDASVFKKSLLINQCAMDI